MTQTKKVYRAWRAAGDADRASPPGRVDSEEAFIHPDCPPLWVGLDGIVGLDKFGVLRRDGGMHAYRFFCLAVSSVVGLLSVFGADLPPVPDKLVVLTFDDSVASHYTVVRPVLKRHGFGATFFITEGFSFRTNKVDYMTWEQIAELHRDGFEIGNHTRDHWSVSPDTLGRLPEQVEAINAQCVQHGIPRPVSFAYPGNALAAGAVPALQRLGFRWARRGGAPEHPYEWGRGVPYEPGKDHPLLIPSAGDARPDWTLADFQAAVAQARAGRIAVLQFHGVPDREHPWVHTAPERFAEFMNYLAQEGFRVVALRDLARYVDPSVVPADPEQIIESRRRARSEVLVEGEVREAITRKPIAARLYVEGPGGSWHFPKSASLQGSAVRYERRNSGNPRSTEMHTTLSAHPFKLELAPGRYVFRLERGKEYLPVRAEVEVKPGMAKLRWELRRWVDMASLGWFSGDAHNHRNPRDLPNVLLAEDVNVGLPMVDWTTVSTVSPRESKQGFQGVTAEGPVTIDATHVWYPRNTEYEIFRVGATPHTLGAFLLLNHRERFAQPVFPLKAVVEQARREGALIDLEKHNWPWSMAMVPVLGVDLFELANNHHWQTEYALRSWAVPAPAWMGITGTGTDTEAGWTEYGFQTYYALLNCGFRLRPTAGTANGVHPVPLGFGRVYVHLDEPFHYAGWIRGLGAGRSFVTTGPMLMATLDGLGPGERPAYGVLGQPSTLECRVMSMEPVDRIELIVNGAVQERFTPESRRRDQGGWEARVTTRYTPTGTSWLAWRCYETRESNRVRFAHSAPWFIEKAGEPMRPRREQIDWLIASVTTELRRSEGVIPPEGVAAYREALAHYQAIAARLP